MQSPAIEAQVWEAQAIREHPSSQPRLGRVTIAGEPVAGRIDGGPRDGKP